MTPCRLIIDPPQDGAWNMAVDEALLDEAADLGTATLRFYQWREPTLSLGYFQSYAERQTHPASQGATVVRRLSGGGALMHDREVTYSLCLPAAHSMAREAPSLYEVVHRSLIGVLGAWNLEAALYCDDDSAIDHTEEPFLCFARRTSADVVLRSNRGVSSSAKIVGSAQRRRRGAVLQHGAVLLGASRFAPELTGIGELAGKPPTPEALIRPWQEDLAAALNLRFSHAQSERDLHELSIRLKQEKYSTRAWTERR
jgi:lipoyl(octanoyl) transferase